MFVSQSLIHQVNHSYELNPQVIITDEAVAIPYSSGQSFLRKMENYDKKCIFCVAIPYSSGQSFLHVYPTAPDNKISMSQSLIHQVNHSYSHSGTSTTSKSSIVIISFFLFSTPVKSSVRESVFVKLSVREYGSQPCGFTVDF